MKKALIINVLIIVLVASLSIAATFAYFSGVDQSKYADVSTAKVGVNGTYGFNLSFSNLLPGDTQTQRIGIKNVGTAKEDFYVQMLYDNEAHMNFCYDNGWKPMVWVTIKDEWGNVKYDNWICFLYSYNAYGEGMQIPKLAEDVDPETTRYFDILMTLSPTAGNAYQNGFNRDFINLIGVQWNGPAPQPVTQKFWPDGDPNYQ
jgi:predicted ribosomally synthesized peptide with SipW-like signal peptide